MSQGQGEDGDRRKGIRDRRDTANSEGRATGSHDRQVTGKRGELLAADYLRKQGYRLLDTNLRTRLGEVDIVAMDKQTLVFVEVRTRRGQAFGSAAESVTLRKQHKLRQLAEAYLAEHYGGEESLARGKSRPSPGTVAKNLPACRIDVVAITVGSSGTAERIELIKSAVEC